jgi:hypothetical protein
MRIAAVTLIILTLQATPALAQCNIACAPDRAPFAGCKPSSLERPLENRIGVVGRVTYIGSDSRNCMGIASVEIVKTSTDGLPSRIDVEYDPCERWGAHVDKIVDFYVWQRARPTGAYTHAPCPG